ncbi:cytochrome P450 [Massariosphaeria phaeospora]|uniref:Cytochrome P450 n=1 Tax=Massariosphaeria phaeospora TaxID=100035 RepID=A0A7C8MEZ0_9PLEO|nr:cytochrome P450 [Massariosphaeria phaeospora]
MASPLIITLLLPPILFLVFTLYSLLRNYLIARKIGLPIIILPISPENPVWMLLAHHVVPLLQYVPFGNGNFSKFCHIGWEFEDKYHAHEELGDAFVHVTPGKNWIYLCNAETMHDVIRRERQGDFGRPVELLAMLDVFGPNLSTAQGSDWQRQRKCTAATFNEQSNVLVWNEALRQGAQLLDYWTARGDKGTQSIAHDVKTLALDVLIHVGFGKSFDFQGYEDKVRSASQPEAALTYRDALGKILENAILILALGPNTLRRLSFIPALGRLSTAADLFKQYMVDIFEETQQNKQQGTRGNLLTSLARASIEDKTITPEEVYGNIFVYNFAGHDTTAHTFAFTFMLLAAYPEVQDWVCEEINYVLQDTKSDVSTVNYDTFPRFVRTLALLHETLRLYSPTLGIVKGTERQPARLNIGGREIVVPPHTRVDFDTNALHSHPRYWGADSLEWKPSRWITAAPGQGPRPARESLVMPADHSYIPFSDGMRACPGKKFAQVEHVAVMVAVLQRHRVVPVRRAGEDDASARSRVLRGVKEDTGMKLLLQMLRPEKSPLRVEEREAVNV